MTKIERLILLNQIAIMVGLKNLRISQDGYAHAAIDIQRFNDAIANTTEHLRNPGARRRAEDR